MKIRRISLLLPDLRGGGAERVMIDLAHEFVSSGCEVEFVLMQAVGDYLPEARRHFSVVDLESARLRTCLPPLTRYLRERTPDGFIANMWPLTSAAVVARALSGCTCRVLLVEHCTLSRQYASSGRMHGLFMSTSMIATYRFADAVAAVSKGTAADTAELAGLPPCRVAVIHNPVAQKAAPSEESRRVADAFWGSSCGTRILSVGSLKEQKNHSLLLRAFAELPCGDAQLMLVGQGVTEPALRRLAAELSIADRVIFAGFHVDPTPFYATSDLFVLSSDYEGFANVIVEALSFGLRIVSTDCPFGPAEILENGRYGHLVPVGDATALSQAMGKALSSPVDADAMKSRAADFAPKIAAHRYLDLLGR